MTLRLVLATVCVAGALYARAQDVPEAARTALEDADRLRAAGHADDARERYREALKLAPALPAAYLGLGALEHAAGRPEEALRVFLEGLKQAPDDRTLLYNAAATALQTGKPKDALGYLDRALAHNDKDAALHALRGSVLQKLDRGDEALAEFQTVVKLDPGSARAQFNLGNVYFRLGRKTEAIDAFQKAVQLDKAFVAAYYNLGAALFEAKRYDDALKAYEVALAPVEKELEAGHPVDASHGRAYLNLGGIFSQRQSWDRALEAYKKAEKIEPKVAAAPYNVGYILYKMDRFDEAFDAYTRAAALDPTLPLANLHRGLIEQRRGHMEASVKLLEQAMPQLDEDGRRAAVVAVARAYQAMGQPDKAREGYEGALLAHPDEIEALVGLGRLLRETGHLAEARSRLEQARKVVLESTGVALELAALAKAEGDRTREKALYGEVLKRDGDKPEMWPVRLSLALLLAGDGQGPAARQEIEVLIKKPDSLRAPEARKLVHTAYGALLARDGDREGAGREFQTVLNEDKSFVPALTGMGVLSALKGDLPAASAGLNALLLGSDFKDVRLLARLDLGQVLWLQGKSAEARPHLEASADAFPDDVAAQDALGEMALLAGDRGTALKRLNTARELCEPAAASGAAAAPPPPKAGRSVLEVTVGAAPAAWICPRVKLALGQALLASAADALDRGRASGAAPLAREARDDAERALALPLSPAAKATGLFLRGTASALLDDAKAARRDLAAALVPELPPALVPLARNNLGAALLQDGAVEEAQQQFETARSLRGALAPAALNLAIALQARGGATPKALALYDEYLTLGGARKEDATRWADALRRVYK